MSDIGPFESFLKWELSIESPSLAYVAKAVTRNVLFAVDIPYPLLKAWHEFLSKAARQNINQSTGTSVDQGPSTSGTSDEVPPYTYTYTHTLICWNFLSLEIPLASGRTPLQEQKFIKIFRD